MSFLISRKEKNKKAWIIDISIFLLILFFDIIFYYFIIGIGGNYIIFIFFLILRKIIPIKRVTKRQITRDSCVAKSINTRNRDQGRTYVNPFNADLSKRGRDRTRGEEEMFCPDPARRYE